MQKQKIIIMCFLLPIFIMLAVVLVKCKTRNDYNQKIVLAQETRKVMDSMMNSLRWGSSASIEGVPADGQWYHQIQFQAKTDKPVQYRRRDNNALELAEKGSMSVVANHIRALNLRRLPGDPAVIEVQILARNSVSLASNFKIRMQD